MCSYNYKKLTNVFAKTLWKKSQRNVRLEKFAELAIVGPIIDLVQVSVRSLEK